MKAFRDLYVHLNGADIEDFVEKLARQCPSPWKRRLDKEKDIESLIGKGFCFERGKKTKSPSAALFLFPKNDDIWHVSNIVPIDVRELSYDQYNEVLEEFLESIVEPVIAGTNIRTEMTSNEITVGSVAGKSVEEALVRFSNLANKSTGSSHPKDRQRWFEFLLLANEAPSKLNADLVIRALIELGWSEDRAYELGSQFEFADDLLSYFRER
jgi:hypothetical protein